MGVRYAEVIGDPIAHSKSPAIHKFWLGKLGIDGDYRAVRVTAEDLPAYFESRRRDPDWRGCNVTMPHKTAVVALMDGLLPAAKLAKAVNTVIVLDGKLGGTNTDVRGFAEPFRNDRDSRGNALVIGTGAAARAAFIALTALDFRHVHLAGRNVSRARSLLKSLGQRSQPLPLDRPPVSINLLVNASAGGMAGHDPLEIDLKRLPPSAIVYDIVYEPLETPLLAQARALGLRTLDGLDMLIGQAAASFWHLFEGEPPRQHDAELRELLTS